MNPLKKLFGPSWKTSSGGALALIAALGAAAKLLYEKNYNFSDPAWAAVLAAIGSAWTGLTARDNKVSTEEAHAKEGAVK